LKIGRGPAIFAEIVEMGAVTGLADRRALLPRHGFTFDTVQMRSSPVSPRWYV